jgi:hypothetical protein
MQIGRWIRQTSRLADKQVDLTDMQVEQEISRWVRQTSKLADM